MLYISIGLALDNGLTHRPKQLSGHKKMENLRVFIESLDAGNKSKFRSLEKLNRKLINTTHSIHFNQNCSKIIVKTMNIFT